MKKKILIMVAVVSIIAILAGTSVVMAAKPSSSEHDVVSWSNGFPSGPHMNLNIHGKNWETCQATQDPEDGWGNSIFVPEDTTGVNILYQMNKKSGLSDLMVVSPCSFDGESATVRLPSGEYQVYARILAKPGKPDSGEPRSVIITPNPDLLDACNLPEGYEDPDGTGNWDCEEWDLVGLGVITKNGAFELENETLTRIAPLSSGGGKGGKNNKAVSISDLFYWSGSWIDAMYDYNGDGEITVADLDKDLDGTPDWDPNEDGLFNEDDVTWIWANLGHEETDKWVFDLADLVTYGWDYENNGSKLVQVRFYPVGETSFIPVD
jgi:hypothetical protein